MSLTRRVDERTELRTVASLVDGAMLGLLVTAIAACHATGLGLAGTALLVATGFGAAFASAGGAGPTDRGLASRSDAPERLERTVGDCCVAMGVDAPWVAVDDGGTGVTLHAGGDRPTLVVGEPLLAALDDDPLRGVVAHELAHRSLGHPRRALVRTAVTHVVGLAALWVVWLRHLTGVLATPTAALVAVLVAAGYLVVAVGPWSGVDLAVCATATAGAVLVPVALSAWAARLAECRADDVAVARSSPTAFCRGLYLAGTATTGDGLSGGAPVEARRSLRARLTARHPSVAFRIARQGVRLADVRDAVDPLEGTAKRASD